MADDRRCANCQKRLKDRQIKFCSKTCEGELKQGARGARAYELRTTGIPWRKIAEELGYASQVVAVSAARRHAKYKRLPWPLRIS